MELIPIDPDGLEIGSPLPFNLWSASGVLLAQRGFVPSSKEVIQLVLGRGDQVCVDAAESRAVRNAYMTGLHDLVDEDKPLQAIHDFKLQAHAVAGPAVAVDRRRKDWLDLLARCRQLLHSPQMPGWLPRLEALETELEQTLSLQADVVLFALISLASSDTRDYSAAHALLTHAVCHHTARVVLKWPADDLRPLGLAALTMNVGMTLLQDQLAQQAKPPTAEQFATIDQHPQRSVALLLAHGITDSRWLEAVLHHHERHPGPLRSRSPVERLTRLLHRADAFAARLSPRANRHALPASAALQFAYLDEQRQPDETGAAIVRAMGLYPPGSCVRLASGELGVVVRRGNKPAAPRVAVLVNRQGLPQSDVVLRDTAQEAFKVQGAVARHEIRVNLPLERLLLLT